MAVNESEGTSKSVEGVIMLSEQTSMLHESYGLYHT